MNSEFGRTATVRDLRAWLEDLEDDTVVMFSTRSEAAGGWFPDVREILWMETLVLLNGDERVPAVLLSKHEPA